MMLSEGRMRRQVAAMECWINMLLALLISAVCLHSVRAQVPATMWAKFNAVNSTEQFMLQLLSRATGSRHHNPLEDVIFTSEGTVDPLTLTVVAGMISRGDRCTPRQTSVPIPAHSDPNVIYYPPCVTMERCGGCCGNDDMLYCAPTKIQPTTHRVLRAHYPHPGADSFVFDEMEDITLDRHEECECRCRVQPYHCHSTKQEYLPDACRCRCLNEKEATKCGSIKIWDDQSCTCRCRSKPSCLMDEVFNEEKCRCETKVPTTTAAPGDSSQYDPCKRMQCGFGREPRRVSDTVCRCQLASAIITSRTRATGHSIERFPMMRAGVFNHRNRRSAHSQKSQQNSGEDELKKKPPANSKGSGNA